MKLRPQQRQAAFTLIEVMMAFAIFGLLVVSIYASWTLILKATTIGQEASARVQRERVAVRTLREALSCVLSFQADQKNYAFVAENDNNGTISFVARLPESFPRSGRYAWQGLDVRRVTFSVESGGDFSRRQLVLRQTPMLKDFSTDERDYPFVVATDVNKIEFEFWDQRKADWINEWTRTNEIPKMIKIKYEFVRRNLREPSAPGVTQEIIDVAPLPGSMVPSAAQGPNQPPRGPINPVTP